MSTIQNPVMVTSTTQAAQNAKTTMGKDDFLQLLVTQMKNQDPLDPMKGTDYAAQLAQFSSLEQLTNINSNLDQSLTANAMMTNAITNALATTFIGKDVRAAASSFQYQGTGPVKLGYSVPTSGDAATVKIYDDAGNLVRTLTGDAVKGLNSVSWDGKNEHGVTVGSGNYTFKVTATDQKGGALDTSTFVFGKVTGVRYKADGAVFVIDGVEIPLANILEIMQG
jgi:flagellar basal-body rod modification protein FlgD